jgi:SPP1 gp7 family putative phage head morphogenesis protein
MGYWEDRAVKRLVASEQIGNQAIKQVSDIYTQALNNLRIEINNVYKNYSNKTNISIPDLTRILDGAEKGRFLVSIQEKMRSLGFSVNQVYKPEYIARITRLEALQEQIYWAVKNIAPKEYLTTTPKYAQVIKTTYDSMMGDLANKVGINSSFAHLDLGVMKEMLNAKWEGRNYSESIWGNVDGLANRLPMIIGGALLSGEGTEKTQRILRTEFGVGIYESARLVRTETNYFNNQADAQTYQDVGIERYRFSAVMDGITSKICKEHNGHIYNLRDKIVGVNYPPLHHNCRSTTEPVLAGETEAQLNKIPHRSAGALDIKTREFFQKQDAKNKIDTMNQGDNKPYHRFDLNNVETLDEAKKFYLEWKKSHGE